MRASIRPTTLLLALLLGGGILVLPGCDDGGAPSPPGPGGVAPPGQPPVPELSPPPDLPTEVWYDDTRLIDEIFFAAATDSTADLAGLALPPRVSRARAAVYALHDVLLERRKVTVTPEQILAALGRLDESEGGCDRDVLGPLLVRWATWGPADLETETALARKASIAVAVLTEESAGIPDLAPYAASVAPGPDGSPAHASMVFLRLAAAALADPNAPVDDGFRERMTASAEAFRGLRWPGGFAQLSALLAEVLARAAPMGPRCRTVIDWAVTAYDEAGDVVGAAALLQLRARIVARKDPAAAERLERSALERLRRAGVRGPELFDALRGQGIRAQAIGHQEVAVERMSDALAEAEYAGEPEAAILDVRLTMARALFHLGRFDEAGAVARNAAEQYDAFVGDTRGGLAGLRAELDLVAARVADETGDPVGAAELFSLAARRLGVAAGDDGALTAAQADQATLFSADALVRAGHVDDALRLVAKVVERDRVQPALRAQAAAVLRNAGRLLHAKEQLSRAERDGGETWAKLLAEEWGRLLAAEGAFEKARKYFARAEQRATGGGREGRWGFPAAQVLESWADMEEQAGDLARAAGLRRRAVAHLSGGELPVLLDRARARLADVVRRRGWFGAAEKTLVARLQAGPPGDGSVRLRAQRDLFLVRLELALARLEGSAEALLGTAGGMPEGTERDLCTAAARLVAGDRDGAMPLPEVGADAPAYLVLLRRVLLLAGTERGGGERVSRALALAREIGPDQPELRRWAAALGLAVGGGEPADRYELIERRRGTDVAPLDELRAILPAGEVLLLVEPCGDFTAVLQVGANEQYLLLDADAALRAFWDAVNVVPTAEELAAAAKGLAERLFDPVAGASEEWWSGGMHTLCVSVPPPLGPLPYDMVPSGRGTLLDRVTVTTVESGTERVRTAALVAPDRLPVLGADGSGTLGRHALVRTASLTGQPTAGELEDLKARIASAREEAPDLARALRKAKLGLRSAWKPTEGDHRVPPWAALLLRGAP